MNIICFKGLFTNDVIIFGGYADPPPPPRHHSSLLVYPPPPPLCDDVIYRVLQNQVTMITTIMWVIIVIIILVLLMILVLMTKEYHITWYWCRNIRENMVEKRVKLFGQGLHRRQELKPVSPALCSSKQRGLCVDDYERLNEKNGVVCIVVGL